jgi:REP-associated tyrosine transposase
MRVWHTLRCATRCKAANNVLSFTMLTNRIYHIYNRGINRQKIFYNDENYEFFLAKVRRYIGCCSEIIGYCFMPNHFHLLVLLTDESLAPRSNNSEPISFSNLSNFSFGLKQTLSSYTKAINSQNDRTGSLFQQNTRRKNTGDGDMNSYALWCLHYIHMNPVSAGFAVHPSDWKYSSYNEYFGEVRRPLCKLNRGKELLYLESNDLEVVKVRAD